MPSKGLTVLIVLFVAGSVYGLSRVDLRRDVPRFPPDYAAMAARGEMVPGPWGGATGVFETPPAGPEGTMPVEPSDTPSSAEAEDTGEIRILDVNLTRLSSEAASPVERSDAPGFVLLVIEKEGGIHWNGVNLGDFAFFRQLLRKKLGEVKNVDLVIVPDRMTPWQYVYWTLDQARMLGLTRVRIGGYPGYDEEKTLLTALDVKLLPKDVKVELPEDMLELVVEVKMAPDDKRAAYRVFEKDAEDLADLFSLASSYNGDYADEFGKEYSRDPAKTPWVVKAPGTIATGHVLVALDALRQAAIYSVRFSGERR